MTFDLSNWAIVVPARLKSERLPLKPLQDLGGKPLIVQVVTNLTPLVKAGAQLLVAVDAPEVAAALHSYGFPSVMTSPELQSGTDRCAAACVDSGCQRPFVLNVQGDEPFVDILDLATLCQAMEQREGFDMGTMVYRSQDAALFFDPNSVKAIRARDGSALYFSRAPIPYARSEPQRQHQPEAHWHHVGVYAFRRDRLATFVNLPPSELEITEKLEQLRALEAGWRILLEPTRSMAKGIDTPEDLEIARRRF